MQFTSDAFVIADHIAASVIRNTSDFSVSANGVLAWGTQSGADRQLAWFDRSGKQIEGLDAREQYFQPSLSPDGNQIAVSRQGVAQPGIANIWILDRVRSSASKLTFGTGAQSSPVGVAFKPLRRLQCISVQICTD